MREGRRRRSLQPGHKRISIPNMMVVKRISVLGMVVFKMISVLDMVVVKRISFLGLVVVILNKGGMIVTESLLDKQVVILDWNWMRKVMDLRSVERRRRSC